MKICPKDLRPCQNDGCSTKYFFEDALEHRNNCENLVISCVYCDKPIIRKNLADHHKVCNKMPLECPNKCEEIILRELLNNHIKNDCHNTLIKCPFTECEIVEKRKWIYDEHVSDCIYRRINCQYCMKEIKFCDETPHLSFDCLMIPTPCILNCEFIVPKGEMNIHIDKICENKILKCKWRCQFQQERKFIYSHETSCIYRVVDCDFCKKGQEFGALNIHFETCGFYPIKCIQDCGEGLVRNQQQQHINSTCINTMIHCSYEEYGCTFVMKRKDLKEHISTSLFEHHELLLSYVANLKKNVIDLDRKQKDFELKTNQTFDKVNGNNKRIEDNLELSKKQTFDRERVLEINMCKRVDDLSSAVYIEIIKN